VDILYNSGGFAMSLERFVAACGSLFTFFSHAAEFFSVKGFFEKPQPPQRAFSLLAELALNLDDTDKLREALAYDWCCRGEGGEWPPGVERPMQLAPEALRRFLSDPANIQKYLPRCVGMEARQLLRRCRVYAFPLLYPPKGWVLFDHGQPGEEGCAEMIQDI
jgi:hypothetical protein